MVPLAVGLALISTVMHAAWNLLARHGRNEAVCFHRLLLVIGIVGFGPAAASHYWTGPLPAAAWGYAAGSGLACGFYYWGLSLGYRSSDFTVVYPVTRSLPVLLLGIIDALRGHEPTAAGWLGLFLVVGGCLLTPLRRLGEFQLGRYLNKSSFWMILAASGTVGYTLLDKLASETLLAGPGAAARYGYLFFVFTYAAYLPLYRATKRHWSAEAVSPGWIKPGAGAVCCFGAYWLILWAYQMVGQASYVVAFRQFSIVLGVVVAFLIYHEPGWRVRLAGTTLMTAGLLVIGLLG